MLFFQVLLLAGYLYAHLVTTHFHGGMQALIHCGLLLLSLGLIAYLWTAWGSPLSPARHWEPLAETDPVLRILSILAIAIGLPYFALSTTCPLLQAWYRPIDQTRSPYRLYAVSNFGSFLGLFAFPILLEPRLSLEAQGRLWTAAYILLAVCCCACAFLARAKSDEAVRVDAESSPVEEA